MTDRSGTQSIERTVRLLKAVAERKDIGWRLTDLAATARFPEPSPDWPPLPWPLV